MSQDLISRYKRSYVPSFQEEDLEDKYREMQTTRGRSSSVFSFASLLLLCLIFTYLEFSAFGHENSIPMYGYLVCSLLALGNLLLSFFSSNLYFHKTRMVVNGALAMVFVLTAMFLQKYSAFQAAEFILLMVWMGSLKTLRVLYGFIANTVASIAFIAVMIITEVSDFWIPLVAILLFGAVMTATYLGYLAERSRRMLFLQTEIAKDMVNRQENWAFTLVDLDIALSGILDFKEMISVLEKHLESVIEFDSYIMTSLEGQGPKPVADKVMGELFEDEDQTLWSEDLLNKLTGLRQFI